MSVVSVRLLPDSLRDPVLALPPRDPVLALPPREGRALFFLGGVFGGILLRLTSSQARDVIRGLEESAVDSAKWCPGANLG